MHLKQTISFCPECYKRIPADIVCEDAIYMVKNCSEHGQFKAMVERDIEFYGRCRAMGQRPIYGGYLIDVTERCNLKCRWCYRGQDNTEDPSIDRLCQEAFMARGYGPLIITGGEPTLRSDLPEVLERLKTIIPGPRMLTNGVKMDEELLGKIIPHLAIQPPNTVSVNLSIHPESNGKDFELVERMRSMGLKLESILWVIDDVSQMDEVVEYALANKDAIGAVRIKAASKMWAEQKPDNHIFTSDMLKYADKFSAKKMWWGNNKTSFFNLDIAGMHFMLVSWYNVNNIDLLDIATPPMYKSKIGLIENLVTSAIVNEGLAKGWVDGMRTENAS